MLVTELMEAGDLWHALVTFQSSGALSWYRRWVLAMNPLGQSRKLAMAFAVGQVA